MRVLVIGGGGREHTICWRLSRDGHQVTCAPGNPAIESVADVVAVDVADHDAVSTLARERNIELVVVGPEAPLVAGLADSLRAAGVAVFGPGKDAAKLEGSKIFAKEFFVRHGIPTADSRTCDSVADVDAALEALGGDVVVKADGLAAGKGVIVCGSVEQARAAAHSMLVEERFGEAGRRVLIEAKLVGQELSVMAVTDGERYHLLAQAEDHKAAFDGDRGPNTGGMGAVSPARWASDALVQKIAREVIEPTIAGLKADGLDFRGVLYAGLMVDDGGEAKILEYNVRFGDPETQVVLPRLRGDFGALLHGAATGELATESLAWDDRAAVCVVLASAGYPGKARTGVDIPDPTAVTADDRFVFVAGAGRGEGGGLITAGGRVLGVTALADSVDSARERAYEAVETMRFAGAHFRSDIGDRKSPGGVA